jgi:hypothetical protein
VESRAGSYEKFYVTNSNDKLNIVASIHNRKLIASLSRELKEKDSQIQELRQTIATFENKLNELSIQTNKQQL